MKDIEIVEINSEQLVMLEQICLQTFAQTGWTAQKIASCFTRNYWLRGLVYQQQLIGFVIIHQLVDETELCCIAIASEFQGNGYGRYLLDYALKQMQLLGYQKLFLEVRKSNVSAISLYRNSGFQAISLRKAYYANFDGTREDAMIMQYIYGDNTHG